VTGIAEHQRAAADASTVAARARARFCNVAHARFALGATPEPRGPSPYIACWRARRRSTLLMSLAFVCCCSLTSIVAVSGRGTGGGRTLQTTADCRATPASNATRTMRWRMPTRSPAHLTAPRISVVSHERVLGSNQGRLSCSPSLVLHTVRHPELLVRVHVSNLLFPPQPVSCPCPGFPSHSCFGPRAVVTTRQRRTRTHACCHHTFLRAYSPAAGTYMSDSVVLRLQILSSTSSQTQTSVQSMPSRCCFLLVLCDVNRPESFQVSCACNLLRCTHQA